MHDDSEVVDTMKPILYPSSATSFNNRGLGALSDAISCVVSEERNGEYELTMEYPVGGIHFDEIHDRAIILAIPSPYRTPQPFRIYSIESPLNGIVTIHAHHISYDLSGIPVSPFTAESCSQALSELVANSVVTNPFTTWTDKSVASTYKLAVPTSFRACLGGQEGSILDVYGKGEYEFDKYDVKLYLNRGSDNGVKIAYGKNLIDFNMERNLETIVTGVYPYWADLDENDIVEGDIITIYDINNPAYLIDSGGAYLIDSDGKYLLVQNPFPFDNVLPLDLSSEFEEKPTKAELKERTEKYIRDNGLGVPRVSIDVSFIQLEQTEEYKDLAVLEACDLCDTVTVEFPMYGISAKAEIIKIETDVLLERYNSVEIGDARPTLADSLAHLEINSVTKNEIKIGNQKAADYINNTKGTFEWIDNGDGTNGGFTIYDADDTSSWLRCTAGGLGISADGGLTYTNAITKNGVVSTQIDVQNNGKTLFYAGYDEDVDGTSISTWSPDYDGKMYEISSGRWLFKPIGEEPYFLPGSWLAKVVLRNPEDDTDKITMQTARFQIPGQAQVTNLTQLTVSSGYNTDNESAGISASANITSGDVAFCQLGVTATNSGALYLDGNASRGYPAFQVLDPTVDSTSHYLKLMKITINGVQYYMFASTN